MTLLIAIAILSAIGVAVGVRPLIVSSRIFSGGAMFVFVIGWIYQAPSLLAKVSGSYSYVVDSNGEVDATMTGLPATLQATSKIWVAVATAALVANSALHRRRPSWSPVGIGWLVILLTGTVVDAAFHSAFSGEPILLALVLVAVMLAALPVRDVAVGASLFIFSVVAAGALVGLVLPDAVHIECVTKCTAVGFLYSGITIHGNALGLLLALSLPAVWISLGARTRIYVVGMLLILLFLTGSRTALAAGGFAVVAMCLAGVRQDDRGLWARRPAVLTAAAVGAAVTAFALPRLVTDDLFATGRGYLWRIADEQLGQSPFVGAGGAAWDRLYADGAFGPASAYSTHNQWQEVLLTTGVLGGGVLMVALLWALFTGTRERRIGTGLMVAASFGLGVLERPLSFSMVNSMTWALVVLVAFSSQAYPARGPTITGVRHRARRPAVPPTTQPEPSLELTG